MSTAAQRAMEALDKAIARAVDALEGEADPWVRERLAREGAERMRLAAEDFGDQRTAAFIIMRDEYDYSLADFKAEFGIARARAAQIINRDAYKERRTARVRAAKKAAKAHKPIQKARGR